MLKPLDTSKWTKSDLVREAKLQTDAIQRLNVWLRLGYSLVAVGVILLVWNSQASSAAVLVGGVACLVVGIPMAGVLKLGTTRARANVEALLAAGGVDVEELRKHPLGDADGERAGKGASSEEKQDK